LAQAFWLKQTNSYPLGLPEARHPQLRDLASRSLAQRAVLPPPRTLLGQRVELSDTIFEI